MHVMQMGDKSTKSPIYTLTRSEKTEDNDLPIIAEKYRKFIKEQEG